MDAKNITAPQEFTDTGFLTVHATTARGTLPLANSTVTISTIINGKQVLYKVISTDQNGQTVKIALPAPPRSRSLTPGQGTPYTSYIVEVDAPNYYPQAITDVQIFPDNVSILPLDMLPNLGLPSVQEQIILNTKKPTV